MKKTFALLCVLLLSLNLLAAPEKSAKDISKEAKKIMKEADKLREKKNYNEALLKYEEVIKLEPDFAFPYFFKGAILNAQKKTLEAIVAYEKGLSLMPSNKQAQLDFMQLVLDHANDLMQEGDIEEANNYYLKILSISEIDKSQKKLYVSLLLQLADNFSRMSDYDRSLEYLEKLSAIPNLEKEFKELVTQLQMLYGVVYSGKDQIEKSNEYIKKFLNLINNDKNNSFYPIAIYYLGANKFSVLEKEVQGFNKQIQQINEEIDVLSNDPKVKPAERQKKEKEIAERMAAVKKAKKEKAVSHQEIEKYLKEAIEIQPQIEQAYVYLGNYYYYCEDFDNAIKYYQLLINNFGNSSEINQYKKFLEVIKKNKERSAQVTERKK